jgi:hypothetical protein
MAGALAFAQAPNPTQQRIVVENGPVFRVSVVEYVERTTKAVNYRHRGGATKIDFEGTPLLPKANGEAKVESKQGYIEIEVEYDELTPATQFGPEYLTYVMWAITPEGRATNLGELLLNGNRGKLNVTTELQSFGMMVTAEPYFAVTQPSDVVVMENIIRPDTRGKVEAVEAKYELLKRGSYTKNIGAPLPKYDPKVPLEHHEAANAISLARAAGADRYATETFNKAIAQLAAAEKDPKKLTTRTSVMSAREAVQTAEDARLIALQRQDEEKLAMERKAAADRTDEANRRAAAEAEARRTADLNAQNAAREAERAAAERNAAQVAAVQAAARAEADAQARANAEQARANAEREAARAAAQKSEAEAARAAAENARLAA